MVVNNYEGTNVCKKIEDKIIGFLERPGVHSSNISAVLFTDIAEPIVPRFSEIAQPTAVNVEARLLELHNKGREALPLEGKYWACVDDFLAGNRPEYAGRIDADKAGELGLFDQRKPMVKIYSDGFYTEY
ncbi:MAG: hypothetical protein AB1668_05225 [Nanoarchaeota archaeon]